MTAANGLPSERAARYILRVDSAPDIASLLARRSSSGAVERANYQRPDVAANAYLFERTDTFHRKCSLAD